MTTSSLEESFTHTWRAEVLRGRPPILPSRHFVYPAAVEEVELGALEVMVRPAAGAPFLATCALGFASPAVPTGLWACPHPDWICAVSGGYAYLINTLRPEEWEQVQYRPVTEVRALPEHELLLFASFHTVEAWGREGKRWRSGRLSSEGLRLSEVRDGTLHGWGWEMRTDKEFEFALDLATGAHSGVPSF